MASDPRDGGNVNLERLQPGPLIRIANGDLAVDIAAVAGGRIAQITRGDSQWLIGFDEMHASPIAWGSYPMLPWAGRLRHGCFELDGTHHALSTNLDGHAIHGIGFTQPWQIEWQLPTRVELSLLLPTDARWPFGGRAWQRIEVDHNRLRMELSVTAGPRPMPVVLGWHPWFRKPEQIMFEPASCYPRDAEGITVLPTMSPVQPPWDDCFINERPIIVHRDGQALRLTSNCRHWVVYDHTAHATCIEPQTGPPDGFNIEPTVLSPGGRLAAWFELEWLATPNDSGGASHRKCEGEFSEARFVQG